MFALSLTGCNILRYDSFDDSKKYTIIDGSIDFTEEQLNIKKVDFDWGQGEVKVVTSDTGTLSFSETANESLTDSLKARYYIADSTLFIKYSASKATYNNQLQKVATITINQNLVSLAKAIYSFSVAIGELSIESIKTSNLFASVAYGNISTKNVEATSARFLCDRGTQTHENINLKTLGEMKSSYGDITVQLHSSIVGFELSTNIVGGSSLINLNRFPKSDDGFYGTKQESNLKLDIIENYGELTIL